MKILQLYNQQRSVFGGEEAVVNLIGDTLRRHGHEALLWKESSRGIEKSPLKKLKAAANGVFSLSTYQSMRRLLDIERPDVVHVHSVYPMFSPSVLVACRAKRVPAVLHVHSHILTCPNWYHLRNGQVCELCFGGKEYNCLRTNCRGSLAESAAYALRSGIATRLKLFRRNVTLFITLSEFMRERLVRAGFPASRLEILANAVPRAGSELTQISGPGDYIGYSGRLSPEKGVSTLIEAARRTGLPVKIAGDGAEAAILRRHAPANVEFLGQLSGPELHNFYQKSRCIVVPSRSFEQFTMAGAEAMSFGKPLIASRIGALPELVQNQVNGLLFDPDNVEQLSELMMSLWNDPLACRTYGHNARRWAERVCDQERFYAKLISIYDRAIKLTLADDENPGDVAEPHASLQYLAPRAPGER